jgi:hypothetical protein
MIVSKVGSVNTSTVPVGVTAAESLLDYFSINFYEGGTIMEARESPDLNAD